MSKPEAPIKVHYMRSPHHRFVYADGAIHRFTGVNSFALDFFIGMYDINDELYREKEQKTERKVLLPDEIPYTREIQSTVILTPEVALALRDLLSAKLKEFNNLKSENEE
ncbi:MAG: hypothetical protein ACRD4B_05945 [Acidobacteriota bacterium]